MNTAAVWGWLGRIPFDRAAALQERLRGEILRGERPSTLLLCEHDPVITLGRSAHPEHVLAAPDELARRGSPSARPAGAATSPITAPASWSAIPSSAWDAGCWRTWNRWPV